MKLNSHPLAVLGSLATIPGVAILAQAAADAIVPVPTWVGFVRDAGITGVAIAAFYFFYRYLREERSAREAENAKRDTVAKTMADDFQSTTRALVGRFEAQQNQLAERFEGHQDKLVGIMREAIEGLATHDVIVKELANRQHKLEMDIYHHLPSIARPDRKELPPDDGPGTRG